MRSTAQNDKDRLEWEEMKRRGKLQYFVLNAVIWTGAYTIANDLFLGLEKLGLILGTATSQLDILVCGVFTGGTWAAWHWSGMERKFRNPPPEEDWMAK
jgi:hypothetical protein